MTAFYQHPQALVEGNSIGQGTRIWAFAHVLPGAVIGEYCNICDHVFIESEVVVGDRVTIKCGVQLWNGTTLEDDVFIGPNVTFTNDPMPRSRHYLSEHPKTVIKKGASIGANATVLPGITVGQHAMVGAGAVVTASVPAFAVAVGNPARVERYVETFPTTLDLPSRDLSRSPEVIVKGVALIRVPIIDDPRGSLIAREIKNGLPFVPERYFTVFDVPTKEVRGEHAHRLCRQFLVCLQGSVHVVCDDAENRQEFILDSPEAGLYLPPLVWATQYRYTPNALLLVMASHRYDPDDYIRDYEVFRAMVDARKDRVDRPRGLK